MVTSPPFPTSASASAPDRASPRRAPLQLAKVEQSLAELAELGRAMIDAIEADDDARLVAAMQVARGLRAGIGRFGGLHGEGMAGSRQTVERLRGLVAAAQVTEKIADRWLARPLPPDRELLGRPGGDVFLADAMLPAVWDFERDLVVLVGPGVAPLAGALRRLGQERILWYTGGDEPGGDEPGGEAPDALRAEHLDEVAAAVRGYGALPPERLVVRGLGPEGGAPLGEVAAVVRMTLADTRIQRNTISTFNRTWLEQGLVNLPALCDWPSVAALDEDLVGKPLVIVAPGPSLARNIDLLAGLKGKATILAVSHALTALTRAGVTPDFALAVDPQDLRYHFAGTPLGEVAAVINAATVHPELFEVGAPAYLTLSSNGVLDDWLYDLVGDGAVVPGGGSVATTALALALRWRCDPIAVVGLDLSFTGGQYYIGTSCDGDTRAVVSPDGRTISVQGWSVDFHRMKETSSSALRSERAVELPGWHGEPVPSSFMFTLFHRWFEERVRRLKGSVALYNCTEGGARIEGMEHVPLAEFAAVVAGSTVDPGAAVGRAVLARRTIERRAEVAGRLGEMSAALRRTRELARRCRRAAERNATQDSAALGRCERELLRSLASLELLSMLAQAEIGDALVSARDIIDAEEAIARSRRLFEEVDRAAAWLAPRVADAARALGE